MRDARDAVAGRRLAWADHGLHWSHGARRMLEASDGFVETQLGFVALAVAVARAIRLVDGISEGYRGDPLARADCPIPARLLRMLGTRLDWFRDEILHLYDKVRGGRVVKISYTTEPVGLGSSAELLLKRCTRSCVNATLRHL